MPSVEAGSRPCAPLAEIGRVPERPRRLLRPRASWLVGLVMAAVLLCALAVASRAEARIFAVADQNPTMFVAPAWHALAEKRARVVVPWNLAYGAQDRRAASWLDAARDAGATPLVTWGPSGGRLPSRLAFTRAFRAFRKRWPQVREFSTWNEPNLGGRTAKQPQLLVRYFRAMRQTCPTCTVLAPELIDFQSAPAWARRFERAARVRGVIWGLHNYQDVNYFRPLHKTVTSKMLRAVKGPIWLTETGGFVKFKRWSYSERRADRATQHALSIAERAGHRIPRVYLYHWHGSRQNKWDSGLLGHDGTPRAAYWTLAAASGKTAAARAALGLGQNEYQLGILP
jgi:hypothetical protein